MKEDALMRHRPKCGQPQFQADCHLRRSLLWSTMQAVLMKEDALMRHRAQMDSSSSNVIRLGAFEAKFVALRQVCNEACCDTQASAVHHFCCHCCSHRPL